MGSLSILTLVCAAIAAAAFLLAAFGTERLATIGLEPLGLLFFVAAHVAFSFHHHPHA
jgi:hypothetical protein